MLTPWFWLSKTALIMNNQQEKILLPAQIRQLKKMAHHLKPVVQIGKKGLSEALFKEIDEALLAHELIKVQLSPLFKSNWEDMLIEIVRLTESHHIDTIGNIVILFRKRGENSQFLDL